MPKCGEPWHDRTNFYRPVWRHGRQIGKCTDCALDHMEIAADAEARRVDELTALRKQDEPLIRQMLEALETCDESDGYTGLRQFFDDKAVEAAITARPTGGACPRCREFD